jgi:hypothetical protein
MALAGKELLGWGAERPKYAFSGNAMTREGVLTYVVDCDWQRLGIVPPEMRGGTSTPITPQDIRPSISGGVGRLSSRIQPPRAMTTPGFSSHIPRPVYHIAGLHASTSVNITDTRFIPRYVTVQSWNCDFYRYQSVWYLGGCKAQPEMKQEFNVAR